MGLQDQIRGGSSVRHRRVSSVELGPFSAHRRGEPRRASPLAPLAPRVQVRLRVVPRDRAADPHVHADTLAEGRAIEHRGHEERQRQRRARRRRARGVCAKRRRRSRALREQHQPPPVRGQRDLHVVLELVLSDAPEVLRARVPGGAERRRGRALGVEHVCAAQERLHRIRRDRGHERTRDGGERGERAGETRAREHLSHARARIFRVHQRVRGVRGGGERRAEERAPRAFAPRVRAGIGRDVRRPRRGRLGERLGVETQARAALGEDIAVHARNRAGRHSGPRNRPLRDRRPRACARVEDGNRIPTPNAFERERIRRRRPLSPARNRDPRGRSASASRHALAEPPRWQRRSSDASGARLAVPSGQCGRSKT